MTLITNEEICRNVSPRSLNRYEEMCLKKYHKCQEELNDRLSIHKPRLLSISDILCVLKGNWRLIYSCMGWKQKMFMEFDDYSDSDLVEFDQFELAPLSIRHHHKEEFPTTSFVLNMHVREHAAFVLKDLSSLPEILGFEFVSLHFDTYQSVEIREGAWRIYNNEFVRDLYIKQKEKHKETEEENEVMAKLRGESYNKKNFVFSEIPYTYTPLYNE